MTNAEDGSSWMTMIDQIEIPEIEKNTIGI